MKFHEISNFHTSTERLLLPCSPEDSLIEKRVKIGKVCLSFLCRQEEKSTKKSIPSAGPPDTAAGAARRRRRHFEIGLARDFRGFGGPCMRRFKDTVAQEFYLCIFDFLQF